jgi:NAD(P)-dependent dehydrogenase (short-subunit alcohol dehydrogenase family)
MFDLTDKVALVTGAAGGIGKSVSIQLSKQGAKVALVDLTEDKIAEISKQIIADGGEAIYTTMNVKDNSSIKAACDYVATEFGGIDILVNSAGILGTKSIEEMDRDGEWNSVIDVNLTGAFFVCQFALPYLKKSKAGRIINISSISGRNGGFEGSMAYVASKGGMIAITRGMARHLAKHNITVNAVCPATTATEMIEGYTEERVQNQIQHILLNRLGTPEEMSAAVCYLASDEAGFTTGLMFDVNGGAYFG